MPRTRRPFRYELLTMLWQQPLWALPFALFFGVLYAGDWRGIVRVLEISVVFAFCVRFGLAAVTYLILPRLDPSRVEAMAGTGFPTRSLWYAVGAVVGSYVAAIIVHLWIWHQFLGGWRAFAGNGMFALLFTALFSGLSYARTFYLQAVDRARAVEQSRAELAEAELRALRAQINPHFLFNTLNTIASLIAEHPAEAEETTTRLAEAFRYTLAASERSHAPLADELAFVRGCLAIERVRFGERLRVVERIEPGTETAPVPTLLLQPLVENAVRHGIGARTTGGTLTLTARRDGERLILEVADDGPGFDPEQPPRGYGFGLRSVRERLRIAGPPHALEIQPAPGGGTCVRIVLPLSPTPAPDAARPLPPQGDASCDG